MNKIIMKLEETFENKYLKDCSTLHAIRVKNIINELLCIDEELKQRKDNIK